jgi:hypothetical protein
MPLRRAIRAISSSALVAIYSAAAGDDDVGSALTEVASWISDKNTARVNPNKYLLRPKLKRYRGAEECIYDLCGGLLWEINRRNAAAVYVVLMSLLRHDELARAWQVLIECRAPGVAELPKW